MNAFSADVDFGICLIKLHKGRSCDKNAESREYDHQEDKLPPCHEDEMRMFVRWSSPIDH